MLTAAAYFIHHVLLGTAPCVHEAIIRCDSLTCSQHCRHKLLGNIASLGILDFLVCIIACLVWPRIQKQWVGASTAMSLTVPHWARIGAYQALPLPEAHLFVFAMRPCGLCSLSSLHSDCTCLSCDCTHLGGCTHLSWHYNHLSRACTHLSSDCTHISIHSTYLRSCAHLSCCQPKQSKPKSSDWKSITDTMSRVNAVRHLRVVGCLHVGASVASCDSPCTHLSSSKLSF